MSILDEFYKFYDKPKVNKVIVGFSGIDPMPLGFTPDMESISGGGSGGDTQSGESTAISNHEQLDGLYGGEDDGHYHLTREEYNQFKEILQIRREEQESGETFYRLTEAQYDKLRHIIEALFPDESSDEPVIVNGITGEALINLIDTRIQECIKHIDCGEVNSNSNSNTDSSSSEDTNTNTDINP